MTAMIVADRYGPILRLKDIADVLGVEPETARNKIYKGEVPFPVSKQGAHPVAHYLDVAEYIDSLRGAAKRASSQS